MIDSYRFGRIVIDGRTYTQDVILLSDRVLPNWWRKSGHNLLPEDLKAVIEAAPEVLVVGQGSSSRMAISSQARQALSAAGIELISLPTDEACSRYNQLRQKRLAAAALHLTC